MAGGKLFPSNGNKENNCVETTHQMIGKMANPKLRHALTQDEVPRTTSNLEGPPEHQMQDESTLLDASINAAANNELQQPNG